jgi:hypothetical protein
LRRICEQARHRAVAEAEAGAEAEDEVEAGAEAGAETWAGPGLCSGADGIKLLSNIAFAMAAVVFKQVVLLWPSSPHTEQRVGRT